MTQQPELTPQQEEFCHVYVQTSNATKAAREVGYSFTSAHNQGYRLLRNPAVQARVAALRAEVARRHCLDAETILAKLESVYATALEGTYYNAAVQALALQARIAGHVSGRAGRSAVGAATEAPPPATDGPSSPTGRGDDAPGAVRRFRRPCGR